MSMTTASEIRSLTPAQAENWSLAIEYRSLVTKFGKNRSWVTKFGK